MDPLLIVAGIAVMGVLATAWRVRRSSRPTYRYTDSVVVAIALSPAVAAGFCLLIGGLRWLGGHAGGGRLALLSGLALGVSIWIYARANRWAEHQAPVTPPETVLRVPTEVRMDAESAAMLEQKVEADALRAAKMRDSLD